MYRRFEKIPVCIYGIYATAYIIYWYYTISITIFFAATWYRKFFVEIVKRLFSCVVHAIWKITFVPTRIQILGHGFTFLVAAVLGAQHFNRYSNTFARYLRLCWIFAILKINNIKNKWLSHKSYFLFGCNMLRVYVLYRKLLHEIRTRYKSQIQYRLIKFWL